MSKPQTMWDVLAVVSPESTPSHLRGVFLTRDKERANQRARACGGLIFKAVDMDAMADGNPPAEQPPSRDGVGK